MVIALSTSHGTRALHRPRRGQVESGAQKIADVTSSLYLRTTATKKETGQRANWMAVLCGGGQRRCPKLVGPARKLDFESSCMMQLITSN